MNSVRVVSLEATGWPFVLLWSVIGGGRWGSDSLPGEELLITKGNTMKRGASGSR